MKFLQCLGYCLKDDWALSWAAFIDHCLGQLWWDGVLNSFYWSLSRAALMRRCSGQLLLIIVSGSFDGALFWTAFIDHWLMQLWWGAVLDSFYWSLSQAALMGRCSGQLLLIVVSGSFDSAVLDSFYWAFDSLIKRQIYLRIFKKFTKLN